MKIMEFDLKWVHMVRYELILRLDGVPWLRIISEPLLTPKGANTNLKMVPTDVKAARSAVMNF